MSLRELAIGRLAMTRAEGASDWQLAMTGDCKRDNHWLSAITGGCYKEELVVSC